MALGLIKFISHYMLDKISALIQTLQILTLDSSVVLSPNGSAQSDSLCNLLSYVQLLPPVLPQLNKLRFIEVIQTPMENVLGDCNHFIESQSV